MGILHREKGDTMINEGEWSYDGFRYYTRPGGSPREYGWGLGSSVGDPSFWINANASGEFIPDPATKIAEIEILPVVGLVTLLTLL